MNSWLEVTISIGEEEEAPGDRKISAVRHTDTAAAATKAKAGVSAKTANNRLIPVRNMFKAAQADGLVEVSRWPRSKIANIRKPRPTRSPRSWPIWRSVTHLNVVYDYFQFAFAAGLRPSEITALRWGTSTGTGERRP